MKARFSPAALLRSRPAFSGAVLLSMTALVLASLTASTIAAAGYISTVAGVGVAGYTGDGGPATSARLYGSSGVASDSSGNFFIADRYNNRIRKVNSSGTITTVAGTGTSGYTGNGGPATLARMAGPPELEIDASGNLLIADYGNNAIRRVSTSGTITTVAGLGPGSPGYTGDGGPATSARLRSPSGIGIANGGGYFIADYGNHVVRKVSSTGIITTIAGIGTAGFSGNGGAATAARLNQPADVIQDGAGNIYIAENGNNVIRKINTSGIISTYAGTAVAGYSGDGGAATSARVYRPNGLALDSLGSLYVSEGSNHVVRKINSSGIISTVAGIGLSGYSGNGGPATSARLASPTDVDINSAGDLLIAEASNHIIRRVERINAPPQPTFTATSPASPANNNLPLVRGTAETGSTVKLYTNSTCTSSVAAIGTAATFASPGLNVGVSDNTTTTYWATATNAAAITSDCSTTSITYVEDSAAPAAPTISAGPGPSGSDDTPTWTFAGEPGGTYECKLMRGVAVVSPLGSCTSPVTYDLSTRPDDTYTFSVHQIDQAGNIGLFATADYILDRGAPPAPSITGAPTSPGSDSTPTWIFTGEVGATFECQLSLGGSLVFGPGSCSSPQTYDLTSQPEGSYTFSIRQRVGAGNFSSFSTSSYTLDRTPPPAPALTPPPAFSNDPNPSWSFAGEAGGTFLCELKRGTTVVSALSTCVSPKSYALTLQIDGTYTFTVFQTDVAGNPSPTVGSDYTLDRGIPAAPAIVTTPADPGNSDSPAWEFTGEPGANFACELTQGATVIFPLSDCTSPHTFDLSSETDGTFTFAVVQTDQAGNTSAAATDDYTMDLTAPPEPALTSTTPGSPANENNPLISGTAEAGSTVTLYTDSDCTSAAAASGSAASFASPGLSVSVPDNSTSTFYATATDAVGNISPCSTTSITFVEDSTTAPAAPEITVAPSDLENDNTPTWEFTGEAGVTFECQLSRGGTSVYPLAACSSPHTYDLTSESDGDYTFVVRAKKLGVTSEAASDTFTLDTSFPVAPTITVTPPDPGKDKTPTWSFTGEAGATFECQLTQGLVVIFAFDDCTSSHTYVLTIEPDATYTFSVQQTDAAGNGPGPVATDDYTLDTAEPAPPTPTELPPDPDNDQTPTWKFTGEPGATFSCELTQGTTVIFASGPCTSLKTYDLSALPDGTYTFKVTQTDAAGNIGLPFADDFTLDTAGPSVTVTSTPPPADNDPTPAWEFTGEPGSTFQCQFSRGSTILQVFGACTSPFIYNLTGEPDGTYTFSIAAIDGVGNLGPVSSFDYILDRVAPAEPTINSSPGATGNDTTPSWGFTGDPSATFQCELKQGATVVLSASPCTSPATFDLSSLPDGTYTFSVVQADTAGNPSPAVTLDYVLDTVAPPAPSISASPPSPGTDSTPTWEFAGDPVSTFECRLLQGTTELAGFASCASPVTFDLGANPDGTYTVEVRQIDPAGNRGPVVSENYVYDAPPTAPVFVSLPAPTGSDASPTFAFVGEAGVTFECRVSRDGDVVLPYGSCTSPATIDLSEFADGSFEFTVRAIDAFGRRGAEVTTTYTLVRVPSKRAAGAPGGGGSEGPAAAAPSEETAAPVAGGPAQPAKTPRKSASAPPRKSQAEPMVERLWSAFSQAVRFPLLLLLLVLLFLVIQNQIDKRDPKLALAPTFSESDLDFSPPPA